MDTTYLCAIRRYGGASSQAAACGHLADAAVKVKRGGEVDLLVGMSRVTVDAVPRRKQVYKITYPNGKIYVGMDLTGAISNFGGPNAKERIAADLAEHRLDLTARKEILWESETATDAEVRAMEVKLILDTGANNPAIGYNLTPRWSG